MDPKPVWEELVLTSLDRVEQDKLWHAEGTAGVHTRMVMEELTSMAGYDTASPPEKAILYNAALLHDIGKIECTQQEGSRIRNHGHALRGAQMARKLLYKEDCHPVFREQICGLIRSHMVPIHTLDTAYNEMCWKALRANTVCRMDWLLMLSTADNKGRKSLESDYDALLGITGFEEMVRDLGCLKTPFAFKSDHSRVIFFRNEGGKSPLYEAFDDTKCEMVLLAGLPGAGKDTYAQKFLPHLPMVSLDDLRKKLDLPHGEPQGAVVAAAREQAKGYLRKKQSFVYNATNLTREYRSNWLNLASHYGARSRIVYLEPPLAKLLKQNSEREAKVPEKDIQRMMGKWEVPDLTEAEKVEHVWGQP